MKYSNLFYTLPIYLLLISCQQTQYDLAIENIKLFDPVTGEVTPDQTLLINKDLVVKITNAGSTYTAHKVIEGRGRLTTPGFIDTHIHLSSIFGEYDQSPPVIPPDSVKEYRQKVAVVYLAYGTTTLAEMGEPDEWLNVTLDWQKNPNPKQPDLLIAGGALISDEEREPYRGHAELADPKDAQRKVREYAKMGVNHLKLYWRLRKPEMLSVLEEADKLGLSVYGHIDEGGVTIQDAMDMGVKHFEHLLATTTSVLSYSQHYQAMAEKYQIPAELQGINEYLAMRLLQFKYIRETPELHQAYVELLKLMADNGASLSTTIHLLGSILDNKTYFRTMAESREPSAHEWLARFDDQLVQQVDEAFDICMEYLNLAHELGVNIRIGTDCQEGGKALWSELLLLSQHGFDMDEILQIATINGAKALNIEHEVGGISEGKKANLVLFEQNPFQNPQHLLSAKQVIKDGQVYTK